MELSVIFLSFCVLFTLCSTQEFEEKPRPCSIAFRCANVEEPVWTTTDNETCQVFRNNCVLSSENCNRLNNYEAEARDIGQEKCQKLCKKCCCCEDITPICGYYNEEPRNFSSPCEMEKLNCETGKTYSLYSEGLCT